MSHWQHRPEPGWKKFEFNQPYAAGLKRLKEEVLAKTDFDPATLWQWGTMQAMAVIQILKDCEVAFGKDGQNVVYGALRKIGYDIGSQILDGCAPPADLGQAEYISYFTTVINRITYASLEAPRIEDENAATFDMSFRGKLNPSYRKKLRPSLGMIYTMSTIPKLNLVNHVNPVRSCSVLGKPVCTGGGIGVS